jgi:hypothetical protein
MDGIVYAPTPKRLKGHFDGFLLLVMGVLLGRRGGEMNILWDYESVIDW